MAINAAKLKLVFRLVRIVLTKPCSPVLLSLIMSRLWHPAMGLPMIGRHEASFSDWENRGIPVSRAVLVQRGSIIGTYMCDIEAGVDATPVAAETMGASNDKMLAVFLGQFGPIFILCKYDSSHGGSIGLTIPFSGSNSAPFTRYFIQHLMLI